MAEAIDAQPAWNEEPQLTEVVWVLDVVADSDGRTLVSIGVESILSQPDSAADPQVIAEGALLLWDIQLEDTPDGWAVRAVAIGPWT